jgi:hypothetical protein
MPLNSISSDYATCRTPRRGKSIAADPALVRLLAMNAIGAC